jgi:hypothetical protein
VKFEAKEGLSFIDISVWWLRRVWVRSLGVWCDNRILLLWQGWNELGLKRFEEFVEDRGGRRHLPL